MKLVETVNMQAFTMLIAKYEAKKAVKQKASWLQLFP